MTHPQGGDGRDQFDETTVTRLSVTLPGPLAVVPSAKVIEQLQRAPTDLVLQFTELSARGALPARLDLDRGQLILYTQRHVAFLYPTKKYDDGYTLGHVSRRSFRDEDRLARAALLLHCPQGWRAFHDLRDMPRGQGMFDQRWSSHWDQLSRAWSALGQPAAGTPSLPSHHREYLDLLTHVVEASRDIELARQSEVPPLPYRSVEPTREERYSGRGVYSFRLVRPGRAGIGVGALVEVADQPGPRLRGKVVRVGDGNLVVRFEKSVDFQQIPSQGQLRLSVSDRVFEAQLNAVTRLGNGEAANTMLLSSLVDGRYTRYQPDLAARPRRELDRHQADAFGRALAVPDVLLVLGPPGTGKTTTIVEIVAALVARGERVLVTSHTNRAVDNVLENLPPEVNTVRIGTEDSMTTAARVRSVDSLVEGVRGGIREAAEPRGQLTAFAANRATLDRWLAYLDERLAAATAAEAGLAAVDEAVEAAVEAVSPPLALARRDAAASLARLTARVEEQERELGRRRDELARREQNAPAGRRPGVFQLVARFRRWRLARAQRRVDALREVLSVTRRERDQAVATVESLAAQTTALLAADPAYGPLLVERDRQVATRDDGYRDVRQAAEVVRGAVRSVHPAMQVWEADPADGPEWARFHTWAVEAVATVTRRADLLGQWHGQVANTETELEREMVRYADVVAATCIGTATSQLLSDIVFDVAVIDEAGQISTPNLLVPMIRARRAVLVGDQHQLPPFLDDEVRGWADSLKMNGQFAPDAARRVEAVLRASGFELLVPGACATGANYVELNLQRRMPEQVARFVSDAFYEGRLLTDHAGSSGDPVFRSPFAMVDTSDRPARERRETSLGGTEARHQRGYVNELEVKLIVSIVGQANRWYRDWAVIVPYKAQARRIADALGRELADPATVADNVGTVDSFQGGERDLIVYGFTRSNDRGSVGFLTELRRLNVAVSRAKQQLVMVGDLATLRSATDTEFRKMIDTMVGHLRRYGDLRASTEVEKLLGSQP